MRYLDKDKQSLMTFFDVLRFERCVHAHYSDDY